jgi:hypothetical protein
MMASSIESIVDKLQRLSEPRLKIISEFVDFLDSQESYTEQNIAQIPESKSTVDSDDFANSLDQLISQVTQARGKDAPILSDYAVSRAGIYEEHD